MMSIYSEMSWVLRICSTAKVTHWVILSSIRLSKALVESMDLGMDVKSQGT